MIMTFCTAYCQAHKGFTGRIGSVNYIFHAEFFFNDSTFHILLVVAIESCSN